MDTERLKTGDVCQSASVPGRCQTTRDQDLNATLHTIYRSFGDVRPTDALISLLTARQAD